MRVNLDIPLRLSELTALKSARLSPYSTELCVTALTTDTREAHPGDLFVPTCNGKASGEDFVPEALNIGCIAASQYSPHAQIKVSSTKDFLLDIAHLYKSKLTRLIKTVGITGSVGKTTTKSFLKKIASRSFVTHASQGNYNNHIGLPLSVLSAPKDTEVLILEMGMNHEGEISSLSKSANPDIAVITAITDSHIGNLGTRDAIKRAKLEILDGMTGGYILLPYGEYSIEVSGVKTVSSACRSADFTLLRSGENAYTFTSYLENIELKPKISGPHNLSNLAFAIAASQLLGMSKNEIIDGVDAIDNGDLRQRLIGLDGYSILDDSYNASYESIAADLEYMMELYSPPIGALLGDVLELGERAEEIHEKIGAAASLYRLDHLYCYGRYANLIAKGAINSGFNVNNIYVNTNPLRRDVTINQIKKNHYPGEIILFKASNKLKLSEIAEALAEERKSIDR